MITTNKAISDLIISSPDDEIVAHAELAGKAIVIKSYNARSLQEAQLILYLYHRKID